MHSDGFYRWILYPIHLSIPWWWLYGYHHYTGDHVRFASGDYMVLWILNINRTGSLNHVCTGSEITSVRYQVTTRPPLAFYICFPWCILYPPHGFVWKNRESPKVCCLMLIIKLVLLRSPGCTAGVQSCSSCTDYLKQRVRTVILRTSHVLLKTWF